MTEPILNTLEALLVTIFGAAVGTNEFYIAVVVTLLSAVIAARIMLGLFGSGAGLIRVTLGFLLPLVVGGLAFAFTAVYAVPSVDAVWAPTYLPWLGFVALAVCTLLVLTRHLFGRGRLLSLLIYALSGIVGVAGLFCSGVVIEVMNESGSKIEQREERINDAADKAL